MSVFGILIALGLLVWLAYRGWSILLLAPLSALIAALLAGQLLLANRTQTFMSNAAGFVGQFFPIFLLGALFGKLMEASGLVEVIAKYLTERLGTKRAMLAIVLASCWRRWATPCSRLPIYGRGHRTRKEDACVGQSTLLLSRSNMGAPTAFSSC